LTFWITPLRFFALPTKNQLPFKTLLNIGACMNISDFKGIDEKLPIALLFDVDELLFSNRKEIYSAYKALLDSRNIKMHSNEQFLGRNLFEIIENIRSNYGLSDSLDDLIAERRKFYIEELKNSDSSPCDGVRSLFNLLESNEDKDRIKVAYVTSSEYAFVEIVLRRIFTEIGLEKYQHEPDLFFYQSNGIEASSCWKDGMKKKPHPQLYLNTISRIGVPPEQCIAFEDSLGGFQAAYSAGTNIVIVPSPSSVESFQDMVPGVVYEDRKCRLHTLEEFAPALENLILSTVS